MKKTTILTLMLGLFTYAISFGQDCEKMLQNGLYEHFSMTNTGSFSSDFKSYLTSSTFTTDLKNGKWGGGITVPINGVPVSLSANSDNTEISTFQQNILQDISFNVKQEYYNLIVRDIPNVALAKVYSDCLPLVGFRVSPSSTGTDATFVIKYLPQNQKDPKPKVSYFNISNANQIQNAPASGQEMELSTIVTCKRDPKKDLILVLQTDRGAVTSKIDAAEIESNIESPIGSIICSLLDFDQFSFATSNNVQSPNGKWDSKFSKWAPADGRLVTYSKYSKVTLLDKLPDMRGVFLRGVNVFDPVIELNPSSSVKPVDESQKNPDNPKAGVFQKDEFKKHSHGTAGHYQEYSLEGPHSLFRLMEGTGGHETDVAGTSTETRPKNVSVFYYIRIN